MSIHAAAAYHPFAGQDFNWLLASRAERSPHRLFLAWEPFESSPRQWTYAQFYGWVGQIAAGLRIRGLREGDRLLLHLDNCPEFLAVWCACAELGVLVVTTNTRSSADEVAYFASHGRCTVAVTQPSLASRLPETGLRWVAIVAATDESMPCAAPWPTLAWSELEKHDAPASRPLPARDPARPLCVMYTSGTTSRPKGVVYTHGNVLWAARINATQEALRPDDVHHVVLPLFHTNALSYSFLPTLWAGGTVVLQPRFSVSRYWEVALRHRTTWASLVPFCFRALQSAPIPPAHSLRCFGTGTADAPYARAFGVPVFSWYGMTETVGHPVVGLHDLPNTPGTIGRPSPYYEVRVLDEHGQPTPAGAIGDLRVRGWRGVSLFAGYLDDEDATAAAFDEDGYFITGDRVSVLPDGSLQFAEREKDMLKVGGENVASSEIERVLASVAGVTEVAVVGQPHPMLDEVPVAFVTVDPLLKESQRTALAETALQACRSRLADFKVPTAVMVLDEFPRGTLEKISKRELRARLEAAGSSADSKLSSAVGTD